MISGDAQVMAIKPTLRSFFSSGFFSCAMAWMAPRAPAGRAAATAARSVDKTMGIVTIEMKTSFMQPASGALTARGKLLHRTRSTAFTEGMVYDAQGRPCAHATGTFRYVPKAPDPMSPPTD